MAGICSLVLLTLFVATSSSNDLLKEAASVNDALFVDDQCAAGDSDCALNALQMKGQLKTAAAEAADDDFEAQAYADADAEADADYGADVANEEYYDDEAGANSSDELEGSCHSYGCHGGFKSWRRCQCTENCERYGNCCHDYHATCARGAPQAVSISHPGVHSNFQGCFAIPQEYKLAWSAEGENFLDSFTFMTVDETHGAQQYLTKEEAIRAGIAVSTARSTQLRVGKVIPSTAPNAAHKRESVMLHSNFAWKPEEGMLVVMKYNHVPYGAGVWPAFWLMNSDEIWPNGGEFDIMEYANDEVGKITFHTNRNCFLDQRKLGMCMRGKPIGRNSGPMNCNTNYFKNLLGCRPRQIQRSGEWYAKNPGVLAAAWDENGVTVYHIPKYEIPHDLKNDVPKPETWSRFVVAYLPFNKRTCAKVAKKQEIVLNTALCGDWAGNAWFRSPAARRTGVTHGCRAILSNPNHDCCTRFVTEDTHRVNGYFNHRAYFDIEYMKVYTPSGKDKPQLNSGTYERGGVPLTDQPGLGR
eukprot:TRINITY_DN5878_c0_g1_i1.p1 TRINITY_DN5878_c0_g1~~TRINITY_DN5878_c0_g1_i1.p1  ORF type:complete len:528 (-),score=107.88 TRINITY_DN5878_c0_g1_i1:670-2253(-)